MKKIMLVSVMLLFVIAAFTRGSLVQNDTTGKSLYIIFDFANAVQTGNYVDVPVMASSKTDSVVSLDFEIKYNSAKLTYVSVSNVLGSKVGMTANNMTDTFKLTSFANILNYYFPENQPLFKIRFNVISASIIESDIQVNLAKIGLEERALNEWIDYNAFTKVTQRTVSAPQIKETSRIRVYPNPSADYIYLESKFDARIELTDLSGKVMFSESIVADKQESVAVDKLKSGVYILLVSGKFFTETHKVIIK